MRQALSRYAELEHEITTIGKRMDPARRADLVRLRRGVSEQIGIVWRLIDADDSLAADVNRQDEMRRLFSAFRYALAQHQANWPVVRVSEFPEDYKNSAEATYAKADDFWNWCSKELGFDRAAAVRRAA
jgi:hypothetical protein